MTYVDTFDWRLYRDGSRLATAVEDGDLTLLWRPPGDGSFCRLPIDRQPDFVWDLPEGTIREQIESSVEVRRLLPVAEVFLQGTVWNVIDRRHKILLTFVLESGTAVNPIDPERKLRLPAALRAERTRPAIDAVTPQSAKALIRIRSVLMPEKRAAIVLPPVASTRRPKTDMCSR